MRMPSSHRTSLTYEMMGLTELRIPNYSKVSQRYSLNDLSWEVFQMINYLEYDHTLIMSFWLKCCPTIRRFTSSQLTWLIYAPIRNHWFPAFASAYIHYSRFEMLRGRRHGASRSWHTYLRFLMRHTMASFEGTTSIADDALRSTLSKLANGRAMWADSISH